MGRLALAACILGLFTGPAAAGPAPGSEAPYWWVFLNKGPNRDQPRAELEAGQKAHIANLERLWKAGLAALAGPLADDGFTRGIVIVRARSREELDQHFVPDPFVAGGRLVVEAYPWDGTMPELQPPGAGLDTGTLVVVRKGPAWSAGADADAEHEKTLAGLRASGLLALGGRLHGGGDKLEALLFRTGSMDRVRAELGKDPAARAGHVVFDLHPQMYGKGMLGPLLDPPASPQP